LRAGTWTKLICGASLEDLPQVRMLSEVYTLAAVDCIDCAADPAVVRAVLAGVAAANDVRRDAGLSLRKPYVMVSVNDDEDPHFRKAAFNPQLCPLDCPRPCERICPTRAISPGGVTNDLCYGCGRCIPACPLKLIAANTYVRSPAAVLQLLRDLPVDAVEIHTRYKRREPFAKLWSVLESWAVQDLKLIAVSFPDGADVEDHLQFMHATVRRSFAKDLVWQTDGRPMSGDVGRGAAYPSVKFAKKILQLLARENLSGFVQLAGGTNNATVEIMAREHVLGAAAGVAFGGYARKIVSDASNNDALKAALGLTLPIKCPVPALS